MAITVSTQPPMIVAATMATAATIRASWGRMSGGCFLTRSRVSLGDEFRPDAVPVSRPQFAAGDVTACCSLNGRTVLGRHRLSGAPITDDRLANTEAARQFVNPVGGADSSVECFHGRPLKHNRVYVSTPLCLPVR